MVVDLVIPQKDGYLRIGSKNKGEWVHFILTLKNKLDGSVKP